MKIVEHKEFYKLLHKDKSFCVVKDFIKLICENIMILNENKLVHGDINSNNIEFFIDEENHSIENVRIKSSEQSYEFGQAFDHQYVKPQYYEFTPPEILQNIDRNVQSAYLEG